jgi:hypothetical protein
MTFVFLHSKIHSFYFGFIYSQGENSDQVLGDPAFTELYHFQVH